MPAPAIGQPAKRDGQQQIDESGAGEQQREVLGREVLAPLQGKIKKSVPDSQHAQHRGYREQPTQPRQDG
jgi:hypothetical protein